MFKKIKLKEGKVKIETLRKITDKAYKTETLESFEAPLSSFPAALQALAPFILKICALPEDYIMGLEVIGTSFNMDESKGDLNVTITALKSIDGLNSPLVINTPNVCTESVSAEFCVAVDHLCDEAQRYIDGERAETQLKLVEAA